MRTHILGVPHVQALHDLHASSVDTNLPVLTAPVVDDECFPDGHLPGLLHQLQQCLSGHFDVEHSTFQFERRWPRRARTPRRDDTTPPTA